MSTYVNLLRNNIKKFNFARFQLFSAKPLMYCISLEISLLALL